MGFHKQRKIQTKNWSGRGLSNKKLIVLERLYALRCKYPEAELYRSLNQYLETKGMLTEKQCRLIKWYYFNSKKIGNRARSGIERGSVDEPVYDRQAFNCRT